MIKFYIGKYLVFKSVNGFFYAIDTITLMCKTLGLNANIADLQGGK